MSIVLARQLVPLDLVRFDTFEGFRAGQAKVVTKHPVELGPDVSDHVEVGNFVLQFRGYVTDTPSVLPSLTVEKALLWFELIGGALVVATTPRGIYRDLVVTAAPYDYRGTLCGIDVVCEQVRLAAPVSVPIPPRQPNPAAAAGQSSAQDVGTQAASPAATAPSAGASLLATLLGTSG